MVWERLQTKTEASDGAQSLGRVFGVCTGKERWRQKGSKKEETEMRICIG